MSGDKIIPLFACRGSDGIKLYSFGCDTGLQLLQSIDSDTIRFLTFSDDGSKFVYSDENHIRTVSCKTLAIISEIEKKRANHLELSPSGNIIVCYDVFFTSKEFPQGTQNLSFYDSNSGKLLKAAVHKEGDSWKPQWFDDESYAARYSNGEVHFYKNNQFNISPCSRLIVSGMRSFVLGKSSRTKNLAVYIPKKKDQPAVVRIYKWQETETGGDSIQIAQKTFFRADTVSLHWNDQGTDLLVLTSTKLSDKSYYGDQTLYFMSTRASIDSANVPMPRDGPIYQVAWRPAIYHSNANRSGATGSDLMANVFFVCHGTTPASVTVFDLHCRVLTSIGSGPWNQLHFSPHGHLLLTAGFGSLPGNCTLWQVPLKLSTASQKQQNDKSDGKQQSSTGIAQRLADFAMPDTTWLSWTPDGLHFLTGTTAPRLRVNNSISIWHCLGKKIINNPTSARANPRPATVDLPAATHHELYQVGMPPVKPLGPPPKPSASEKFEAATALASPPTRAYVPPGMRGKPNSLRETMSLQSAGSFRASVPVGFDMNAHEQELKKTARNRQKRESKKKRKNVGDADTGALETSSATDQSAAIANATSKQIATGSSGVNGDAIKAITKRLKKVEKLKTDLNLGKQLDKTQMDIVNSEAQLRAELTVLSLQSAN